MRIVSHRIAIALIFNSSVRPLGDARESAAFSGSIVCFPKFSQKGAVRVDRTAKSQPCENIEFFMVDGVARSVAVHYITGRPPSSAGNPVLPRAGGTA
jgi:hypothetical protein